MKRLTKFALMRPVTLLLTLVTIFYFGLQGVLGSPMEMTPDINFPMMILATVYPGASPEDITETVGKKIEGAVGTLSGIDNVYTYAMENTCMNMLVYNYGTNMDTAYLDLRKSMDQIKSQLPEDAEDTLILEMDMNAMPVMQIMIQGGTDGNLRSFVNDQIVPELEKISSVAEVTIGGGRDHYIRIELIREKMDQYHLTMDTLAQIVGAADFTIPAGTVTGPVSSDHGHPGADRRRRGFHDPGRHSDIRRPGPERESRRELQERGASEADRHPAVYRRDHPPFRRGERLRQAEGPGEHRPL